MRIFRKTLAIWQGIFWLKMRVFFISQGVLNFGILEFLKMRVFRKTLAIWQGIFWILENACFFKILRFKKAFFWLKKRFF